MNATMTAVIVLTTIWAIAMVSCLLAIRNASRAIKSAEAALEAVRSRGDQQ